MSLLTPLCIPHHGHCLNQSLHFPTLFLKLVCSFITKKKKKASSLVPGMVDFQCAGIVPDFILGFRCLAGGLAWYRAFWSVKGEGGRTLT